MADYRFQVFAGEATKNDYMHQAVLSFVYNAMGRKGYCDVKVNGDYVEVLLSRSSKTVEDQVKAYIDGFCYASLYNSSKEIIR